MCWRKELRPDSGGPGRTRGGLGQVMEIGAKGDAEFACNAVFDRAILDAIGRLKLPRRPDGKTETISVPINLRDLSAPAAP